MKRYYSHGFTIVELLIVIVVIAILATITVVAYNGITSRVSDSAVQSDLRNYASKVLEFQAINGRYPTGNCCGDPTEGIPTFSITKTAYETSIHNFYYCTGGSGSTEVFAVAGQSKSGKRFAYYSSQGLTQYTGAWGSSGTICPGLGMPAGYTYSYAYNYTSGWWSWAG